MRAVSLFSGIGGFDLGLERAGIETVLQVEIDPFCRRVLEKHWPDVRRIADVRDVTAEDCEGVDLIYGGFPCQPVSVAGAKRGTEDERWLWPEFARLVGEVRPRYVLVENVPGLLTAGMGDVLGDLSALGYDAEWDAIPAAAVGAPHFRYRIFIVAWSQQRRTLADTDDRRPRDTVQAGRDAAGDGRSHVADAESVGRERSGGARRGRLGLADCGPDVADADRTRLPLARDTGAAQESPPRVYAGTASDRGSWWATEPDVGRVAHGVPARVDRLRALGNAVVPQVAEYVGRRLVEFDRSQRLFEAHDLSDQQRGVPAKANNQSRLRGA